jgi:hypothetical protein
MGARNGLFLISNEDVGVLSEPGRMSASQVGYHGYSRRTLGRLSSWMFSIAPFKALLI